MKTPQTNTNSLRWCLALMAGLVLAPFTNAQIVTNWVAFNDHRPGPDGTSDPGWGTAPRATSYDMGVTAGGGNLTNFLDGAQLPVIMTVTPNGSPDDFGTAFPPNVGTPAYNLFFGACDLSNDGIVGVRFSSDTYVTFTFSNLDPDKRYVFRGTSARGGSYLLRWAVASIAGVDGSFDGHTDGVLTHLDFPASLEPGQAAWNGGENREGEVVGWDFINPGADGSFSIICSNYVGEIPGNQNADNTRYGYSFGAMLLAEVEASAPVITQQPAPTTTVEQNRSFTLSVTATGTPLQYQWYKEGVGPIDGATFPTYHVAQASLEDSGNYYVVILNPVENVTSDIAQVTVNPDNDPPAVAAVFAFPNVDPVTRVATMDQITVEFDEPVQEAAASLATSYIVPGGGNPTSVTVTNSTTVILQLASALTEDTDYSVTISGVSDVLGNTVGSLEAPFHTWVSSPGNGLLFEMFAVGTGVETAILTNSPLFPDSPFFRTNLYAFDTRVALPDNDLNDFGSRTRGVFIPPVSGDWVFFLRTYDRGEVRFNPNGLDAAGAIPILAEVTGNDPRDWDKFISAPFTLRGGQAYYLEGLQKSGAGGTDVLKVAARLAGTGLPYLGTNNIDIDPSSLTGAFIGTPLALRDLGGALNIVDDLADFTIEENHPVTLAVGLHNPSGLPVFYQWFRDGNPIEGATAPTYTIQPVLGDDGATFRVEMAKLGSTAVSATATMTVVQDVTPPMGEKIISLATSLNTIQLVFNELMASDEVTDPFNFYIEGIPAAMAVLEADGRTVTLTFMDPWTLGQGYQLEVFGGSDLAGNGIDPNPLLIDFVAGSGSPSLTIQLDGAEVVISWPESMSGLVLEETTELVSPASSIVWTTVNAEPMLVDGRHTVRLTVGTGTRVFRLRE